MKVLAPVLRRLCSTLYSPRRITGNSRAYTRFFIMAQRRTGSTLLGSCLKNHPEAHCFGEIFNLRLPMFFTEGLPNDSGLLKAYRAADPRGFLDNIIFQGYESNIRAVGAQIFPEHVCDTRFEVVWESLRTMDSAVFIHLTRRNKVASAVSLARATQTGAWSSGSESAGRRDAAITISPRWLVKDIERREHFEEVFRARLADRMTLEVAYEDLAADLPTELDRVYGFLGLREFASKPALKKQRTGNGRDLIANRAEIEEALSATPRWLAMFTDVW